MHLLVLSCSAKKAPSNEKIAAIDLYAGVFFSVFKKAMREHPHLHKNIVPVIVSAKYGLISADKLIDYYDLKMTSEIAASQRFMNTDRLNNIIRDIHPQSIVVVMGKTYLKSIDFVRFDVPITFISGSIGIMLHDLKKWLNNMNGGDASAD